MKFQILSHAGLVVTSRGVQLVCDPWLVGSTYWRSWWNYPPVSSALVASLKPDFIYLTHIHWDHFQGVSLRKFSKSTTILIPKAPYSRIKRDLNRLGFHNVVELKHGESIELAPEFRLTSYHFNVFLDSAIVIECEGQTLLNANDAKFVGLPLKQILRKHKKIDFVLRSHSSANSRLCYEMIDDPSQEVDDQSRYAEGFASFVIASGATYAIPFASNHCHLHKDTFRFNSTVTTPQMVARHFKVHRIRKPEVKIMVSGDSWSSDKGFEVSSENFFENRADRLEEYLSSQREKLERFYSMEEKVGLTREQVQRYFDKLFRATPFPLRLLLKGQRFTYVASAGEKQYIFEVNYYDRQVKELTTYNDEANPIQIHTSSFVLQQCMSKNLFSHLPISKRVKYRLMSNKKRYVQLFNLILNLYEYEMLPIRSMLTFRFIGAWCRRWREIYLYQQLFFDLITTRKINIDEYLPAGNES